MPSFPLTVVLGGRSSMTMHSNCALSLSSQGTCQEALWLLAPHPALQGSPPCLNQATALLSPCSLERSARSSCQLLRQHRGMMASPEGRQLAGRTTKLCLVSKSDSPRHILSRD